MKGNAKLSFLLLVCILFSQPAFAVLYTFDIFSDNGAYYDDPGIDLYMDVANGNNVAQFTFYNDSTIDCTVTRIYFDDGTLIGSTLNVLNGSGALFSEVAPGPGNLPGGEEIGFYADREFNIGAEAPPPVNGINTIGAGEWVTIEFDLVGGALQNVLNELDDGSLRVGLHVMAFPDGSSNGAVNIPEPATMCILALGAMAIRKRS